MSVIQCPKELFNKAKFLCSSCLLLFSSWGFFPCYSSISAWFTDKISSSQNQSHFHNLSLTDLNMKHLTTVVCLLRSCNVLASQHIYTFLNSSYQHSPHCHVIFSYNHLFCLHYKRSAALTMHTGLLIRLLSKRPFQTFRLKKMTNFWRLGTFFRKVKLLNNNFQNSSFYITIVQLFFFP